MVSCHRSPWWPEDHEGGGWVRMYQTKGEKLVPFTDWFRGYRDIVLEEVKKAAKAEEKEAIASGLCYS